MVFPRAICNNIAPRPRIFFVRGRRPRTKKIRGRGAILLHIARGKNHIYNIYPIFLSLTFHLDQLVNSNKIFYK